MRLLIRAFTALAIAATVAVGAGPSCSSSGGWNYSTSINYSDPYRTGGLGPGIGCNRIPAPSQC